MARGVNKVILVGNVGQDPEVRYTPSGAAIANITLATSETWKDKQTGQPQERTEWHRLVFFNRLAEIAGKYVRKGSKLYVEGSLQTRQWDDKQSGGKRYSTEIKVSEMQMLDSKKDQQQANTGQYQQSQNTGQHQRQNQHTGQPSSQQGTPTQPNIDNGFPDDDIPF